MQWRVYSRKDYAAFTVGNVPVKAKQDPSANGNAHLAKRSTFLMRSVVSVFFLALFIIPTAFWMMLIFYL
jgi:hypothetical protein